MPPEERIAVFDNDGTLWCEKPMPIELGFILQRLAEMAAKDETLRGRQPWKAAHEHDYAWLSGVITKHYEGDDSDVKVLMGGILQAFAGWTVDDYGVAAHSFVHEQQHPTLNRSFAACGYQPMIELLRYLEDNGFTCYIASGGDRDFMRPVTGEIYGIPPERVIGSSNALRYDEEGGSIVYLAEPDVFDDGPVKPVRIWSRTGRRPILAGGNSNGDIPMLACGGRSAAADPPRRPGAGVRLRCGRRKVPRARTSGGLDGREHQGRLVDGVRALIAASTVRSIRTPSATPLRRRSASGRTRTSASDAPDDQARDQVGSEPLAPVPRQPVPNHLSHSRRVYAARIARSSTSGDARRPRRVRP